MPALLWFRRDLRLRDLPPLLRAAADSDEVLACFVLDPRLEASSGGRRMQFLCDSLRQLRDDLDGRLLVTRGRPEERIPALVKEIDAPSVHVSEDFAPYGRRRDDRVRAALGDVPLVATGSPYLVSPGRVTKDNGEPYKVFTPFFGRWRDMGWRSAREIRRQVRAAGSIPSSSASAPSRWRYPTRASNSTFPRARRPRSGSGRSSSTRRLENYGDDRNGPGHDGTSRMSAHLKFGTIHPRTMVADLDQRRAGARAYLRELAFRDFYAAVLHHWPDSVWWNWNRDFDAIEIDTGAKAEQRFEAWKAGKTGFPIVDAGMRQLRETGFMHNRVRMIVASFLVKDLHLPWQWGARWFLDQLVDGDMASNQHGWQWSAGCGTDAAPYFRVFNPTTQAEKFDPAGDYVRRWVAELADVEDVRLTKGDRPSGYPEPIVDHSAERSEALRRYQRN